MQAVLPDFFLRTVPLLDEGDDVSMVLTPQAFHNLDLDTDIFNHSNVHFWQYMQPGADAIGFISCTGTNFLLRSRCLAQVRVLLSSPPQHVSWVTQGNLEQIHLVKFSNCSHCLTLACTKYTDLICWDASWGRDSLTERILLWFYLSRLFNLLGSLQCRWAGFPHTQWLRTMLWGLSWRRKGSNAALSGTT